MWWLLGIVGFSLIGWGALSTPWILYPERRFLTPPDPPPLHTIHALAAQDGTPLPVYLFEAAAPRARLLLCHGYYASRYQVLALAHGLRERGYEVAVFEMRGHGDRPGPCTLGVKELADALSILRWARHRDGTRPLPVGVVGLSMGAAVASQVAFRDPDVRAVVVDSIYSHLFPMLQRVIRQRYHLPTFPWAWVTWIALQLSLGKRLSSIDPAILASHLHQPLLSIQGGEDRRVTPLVGQEFYQRWVGPKERWFEPLVAHVGMFARFPEEYCDRVARFFERTLA